MLVSTASNAKSPPGSKAATESEMKPYSEAIDQTEVKIEMVPIPGGKFLMGSSELEADRQEDEGPQHEVELAPFWMGKYEVTWEAYEVWTDELDILRRKIMGKAATEHDAVADAVTRPTEPYTDMSFGMGKGRHPAISMTQHAARTFCHWLSAKTGRYYRLPTEAEWEYACRAGTTTAYHFGDDPAELDAYAWFDSNSEETTHKVGLKQPNPWGLYDMHGNVREWVLDQYLPGFYSQQEETPASAPLAIPTELYPRVVRGGGWEDDAPLLRSAARIGSSEDWKEQDPQIPQSIWYHTDAQGLGFRIVRPLAEPTEEEKAAKWENTAPEQVDPEDE
ncbi:MAG: formylglycine-generating enzyme family protein [Planctomycetales bacterium]|nr:formylglycine-generating enzyme family protein [Planctomycetales bacterium]